MGLPILNEVHDEITRLAIAGSALAAGDPRIKKYIPALRKLGEKAAVFNTLAERLETLLAADSKDSPEALMDAAVLLYALRYTQGTVETGGEIQETRYAEKPLALGKIPYSRLNLLIEQLTTGSMKDADEAREVFEAGQHKDPRLFAAYCAAIGEKKTPISTYIAETVIPDIGADIVPFVEAALDIKGGKGQARLLTVLSKLKGKAILPLAEKALAEGSEYTMEAAIRILGEDPKYEETLLAYTKDRKSGPKGAAFAALAQIGSEKGDAAILEALDKANVNFLEEALKITGNPAILGKVLDEAAALLPSYKDHAPKLACLLRTLAARDEEPGLAFLEKTLTDTNFRAEAWVVLEIQFVVSILMRADTTRRKTELVYRIAEKDESLVDTKLQAAIKLFSAEEVYEKCHRDASKRNYWYITNAYHIRWGSFTPDSEKTWDRRWGKIFLGKNQVELAASVIYDDDVAAWTALLEEAVNRLKKQKARTAYYSSNFAELLARAFTNKHPQARAYYDKFIALGFPKEELAFILEAEGAEGKEA